MNFEKWLHNNGTNEDCEECCNYNVYTQWHPYGSTYIPETLYECHCINESDCPRYKEYLQKTEKESFETNNKGG